MSARAADGEVRGEIKKKAWCRHGSACAKPFLLYEVISRSQIDISCLAPESWIHIVSVFNFFCLIVTVFCEMTDRL